jgi:chaperone modulatory protein CbpM
MAKRENDEVTFTFIEVCEQINLPERELCELLEYGLFPEDLIPKRIKSTRFSVQKLQRLRSASRLHHDLGVNASGIVLALELLDELEQLRQEVSILQRHLQEP